MSDHDHSVQYPSQPENFWKSCSGVVLITFFAAAGLLLAYDHRNSVFTINRCKPGLRRTVDDLARGTRNAADLVILVL